MRATDFHHLLGQLQRLSRRQRDAMRDRLAAAALPVGQGCGVVAVLNERVAHQPSCPRCGSEKVQRWGKIAGVQRLRCCACARTFNPLTGTPLARLRRRELWFDHAKALDEGLSIRKAGERLGVHYNTTFRWRHRWLENLRDRKATTVAGTVEAETTVFTECRRERHGWTRIAIPRGPRGRRPAPGGQRSGSSRLEVPVLFLRDRHGASTDAILPAFTASAVESVLGPLIDPTKTALCSNGSTVFHAVCRNRRIRHRWPGSKAGRRHGDDTLHRRAVGAYLKRLEVWMRRFKGVGSHYLANYLGWRRLADQYPEGLAAGRWLHLAMTSAPQSTQTAREAMAASC